MPSITIACSFVSSKFVFFLHVYIGLIVYYQVTLVKPSGYRKRETSIYQCQHDITLPQCPMQQVRPILSAKHSSPFKRQVKFKGLKRLPDSLLAVYTEEWTTASSCRAGLSKRAEQRPTSSFFLEPLDHLHMDAKKPPCRCCTQVLPFSEPLLLSTNKPNYM